MTPDEKVETVFITLGIACVMFGVIYLVSLLATVLSQP